MKVYFDNALIATVTLSAANGGYYTAMTVADANGETKATASNVSVNTKANMNIGVAANEDGSIVTTGGLYVDNYGIEGYQFDATVNNPLPGTETGIEQPGNDNDDENKDDNNDDNNDNNNDNNNDENKDDNNNNNNNNNNNQDNKETGDMLSMVIVIAVAAMVVTILAKKKAY